MLWHSVLGILTLCYQCFIESWKILAHNIWLFDKGDKSHEDAKTKQNDNHQWRLVGNKVFSINNNCVHSVSSTPVFRLTQSNSTLNTSLRWSIRMRDFIQLYDSETE